MSLEQIWQFCKFHSKFTERMKVARVRMPLPSNDHATWAAVGCCGMSISAQIAWTSVSERDERETSFIQRFNVEPIGAATGDERCCACV